MKQYTCHCQRTRVVRLSRFVQSVTRDFPTSLLYKQFSATSASKSTAKRVYPKTASKAGDLIELYINDEFFPPEVQAGPQARPQKQHETSPR